MEAQHGTRCISSIATSNVRCWCCWADVHSLPTRSTGDGPSKLSTNKISTPFLQQRPCHFSRIPRKSVPSRMPPVPSRQPAALEQASRKDRYPSISATHKHSEHPAASRWCLAPSPSHPDLSPLATKSPGSRSCFGRFRGFPSAFLKWPSV